MNALINILNNRLDYVDNKIKDIERKLKTGCKLNHDEIELLLNRTSDLINDDDKYSEIVKNICYLSDQNLEDECQRIALNDLIVKARVFIYSDMIKKDFYDDYDFYDLYSFIGKDFYTLESGITLTKNQKCVLDAFDDCNRIIVSAPTSFGKTLLIREIIKKKAYKRIILIFPVVSLLHEVYNELKNLAGYKIINSVMMKDEVDFKNDSYIFILTPERCLNLITEKKEVLDYIDFFSMDELYKIDNKFIDKEENETEEERDKVFRYILYRLAKTSANCYLIGPYINSVPNRILPNYNNNEIKFIKIDTELVQKNEVNLYEMKGNKEFYFADKEIRKYSDNEIQSQCRTIKSIIQQVPGKYIIYVSNQARAESVVNNLSELLEDNINNDSEFMTFLTQLLPSDCTFIKGIKRGIVYHHGGLPRYIQNEIIDVFNDKSSNQINVIVSTTTITEGVNTSAKNIIILDTKKGRKPLTYFDYLNIKGRAGRLNRYFVGNVFNFAGKVEEDEKSLSIDIDYLPPNQKMKEEEIIIYDEDDLTDKNKEKKKSIESQILNCGIDVSLIKMHPLIDISKQMNLINELTKIKETYSKYFNIMGNSNLPISNLKDIVEYLNSDMVVYDKTSDRDYILKNMIVRGIIQMCYINLFSDSEKQLYGEWKDENYRFKEKLLNTAMYYLTEKPQLPLIISMQKNKRTDTNVRKAFEMIRNYFEFILPKYLQVFENIFNGILKQQNNLDETSYKKINLGNYIRKYEYGYYNDHQVILKEMGIPPVIIDKISDYFISDKNFREIKKRYIDDFFNITKKLTDYEISILNKYLE